MTTEKFGVYVQGYWLMSKGQWVPEPTAKCTKLATAKRIVRKLPVVAVIMNQGKVIHEHFPA